MILDKLIEKKDLKAFIAIRRKRLEASKKEQLTLPENQRHPAWKQINGRLLELDFIEKHINKLKEKSKEMWDY